MRESVRAGFLGVLLSYSTQIRITPFICGDVLAVHSPHMAIFEPLLWEQKGRQIHPFPLLILLLAQVYLRVKGMGLVPLWLPSHFDVISAQLSLAGTATATRGRSCCFSKSTYLVKRSQCKVGKAGLADG